jgi:AcrR family transcriptional regulator
MARITPRDWLDTGLRLLAEVGADGLTVEALTAALGVTKGSFYHHFRGFQEFKLALLALFECAGTLDILVQLEGAGPGIAALHRLIDAVAAGPWRVEAAVRAWALHDEDVRACQARIDARRLAYLRALCAALSGDAGRAPAMAEVLYALYVGCLQIGPPLEGAARRRVFEEALRLYNLA